MSDFFNNGKPTFWGYFSDFMSAFLPVILFLIALVVVLVLLTD